MLDSELTHRWSGIEGPPPNDYDRACAVTGYLGKIPVGYGEALVLGQEPLRTTWISRSSNEGFLIRWVYAEDEASVFRSLERLPQNVDCLERLTISFGTREQVLFDASCPGGSLEDRLSLSLTPGQYEVTAVLYRPDEETALLLHRLSST